MKKGIFIGIIYLIMIYMAFLYREPLMDWLDQSDISQLPFMFFLSVFFGVIPVIPFSVFAGLMGVKYGILLGTVINLTGSAGAAVIFFIFARYFFVQQFQTYIAKFSKIKKFDYTISQNAFVAVLFSRLIPVVPPPVVNIYSGLSTMQFKVYAAATVIGQIPGMIVYAYLGNQLFTSTHAFIFGISIYAGFILLVLIIYRWWFKRIQRIPGIGGN
ncbi:TVP38/TMEM64 family protein [Oceanobacillus damuensis]|uniref:TVP38/TMEM64 family protein n=1 Tax=Oceanobacillus damuensis TaxID=937928 RepID=UPI00083065D6|nr:VTT domain-containing protein [Oceanobacillus damuensis]